MVDASRLAAAFGPARQSHPKRGDPRRVSVMRYSLACLGLSRLTRRRNRTLAVRWLTARLLQRDETDKESTNTEQARRKCEPEQQAVRVHARPTCD
jgi:hypothetical protein